MRSISAMCGVNRVVGVNSIMAAEDMSSSLTKVRQKITSLPADHPLKLDEGALQIKTAEFCKRNWNSIKHTLLHILYEFRKVKQGFRKLGGDIRYSVGFNKKLYSQKYNKVDVMAKYKVR